MYDNSDKTDNTDKVSYYVDDNSDKTDKTDKVSYYV